MKSLDTVLQNTIQGSEQLFGEEILSLYHIFGDRYEYTFEVIDVLVYWLVNATCFMIICATANFLKQFHSLQDENLTNNYESFTFCK